MAKIAIIDDDPDIIEATSILLEAQGHQVISASNVTEGLNVIKSENPDLVLLDVMMDEPDDGFYMANKLRKLNFHNPIILLTSVSKTIGYDYAAGDTLPISDFLEKPVSPDELMKKINELLSFKGGQ